MDQKFLHFWAKKNFFNVILLNIFWNLKFTKTIQSIFQWMLLPYWEIFCGFSPFLFKILFKKTIKSIFLSILRIFEITSVHFSRFFLKNAAKFVKMCEFSFCLRFHIKIVNGKFILQRTEPHFTDLGLTCWKNTQKSQLSPCAASIWIIKITENSSCNTFGPPHAPPPGKTTNAFVYQKQKEKKTKADEMKITNLIFKKKVKNTYEKKTLNSKLKILWWKIKITN